MKRWKVSYECLRDKMAHYPFWKRTSIVMARSRLHAIQQVQGRFGPPTYGNYRASAIQVVVNPPDADLQQE